MNQKLLSESFAYLRDWRYWLVLVISGTAIFGLEKLGVLSQTTAIFLAFFASFSAAFLSHNVRKSNAANKP